MHKAFIRSPVLLEIGASMEAPFSIQEITHWVDLTAAEVKSQAAAVRNTRRLGRTSSPVKSTRALDGLIGLPNLPRKSG
jgi:hypothetical protein